MAKNYQKCLSYLDFENSDFYFTEEQKELLAIWNDMDEQGRALAKAYMKGIIRS